MVRGVLRLTNRHLDSEIRVENGSGNATRVVKTSYDVTTDTMSTGTPPRRDFASAVRGEPATPAASVPSAARQAPASCA
jgi:hypothetical protein